jgi:hypothetical protein
MAQRKPEPGGVPAKIDGVKPAIKAGTPIPLHESLKRIHKRHGKLLKKLAE